VLGIHSCIVHEDVNRAERRFRLRYKPRDVNRDREICGDEHRASTGSNQLFGETFSPLLITAVNHDGHIFERELSHDRCTDTGGAAGHERSLSGQVEIHGWSLSNDLNVERQRAQPFPQR
jgi:hypothetical protein